MIQASPMDPAAAGCGYQLLIDLRARWLTAGYVKNPDASAALWEGGYLHTSDIGADGYLRITDRIKDVIKTGGEWISSLEVEDVIARHPAVSEVAVIGVKDEKWGERPFALVVRKADADPAVDAQALQQHMAHYVAKGIISRFGVPERILFVEALPKTSVGKLDKKAMRDTFGAC